jgi:sirohydrochlorin cobaltochelatase
MQRNKGFVIAAVVCAAVIGLSGEAAAAPAKALNAGKKGILVVSFGTSYEAALKDNIGATEKAIAAAFPEYQVRRAFTAGTIIKILKKRGIEVDGVEAALQRMKKEGFSRVVVQPLHLMPGEEFHQLLEALAPYRASFAEVAVGMPLFHDYDSYFAVVEALKPSLPPTAAGEAILLMGHGTKHPANSTYPALQNVLASQGLSVYVGTVEGYPTLDDAKRLLKRDGIRKVTLLPLMLVSGDHANNDMAGDDKDSWKSILEADGYEVEALLRGLGELPGIQSLYVENVKRAIAGLEAAKK